jgi:hypothetical protein
MSKGTFQLNRQNSQEPRERSPFQMNYLLHQNKKHSDPDISAEMNEKECADMLLYFTNRSH